MQVKYTIGLDYGTNSARAAVVRVADGEMVEPIAFRSGQTIALDMIYCPPIQLRNANGVVVFELNGGTQPQRLGAVPGAYVLVGHSPTGEEWTRRINVTGD